MSRKKRSLKERLIGLVVVLVVAGERDCQAGQ